MLQEQITISERTSVISENSGLIISAVRTTGSQADIVVGRPGLTNLDVTLTLGAAALFEAPEGIFEIRALTITATKVILLITRISPRPGIAAGLVDQDPENTPFLPDEVKRIA